MTSHDQPGLHRHLVEMLKLDEHLDDWAIPEPQLGRRLNLDASLDPATEGEPMRYAAPQPEDRIIVVFGGPADGCPLSHCPTHAHGPYTEDEARERIVRLPEWMVPHILTLAPDTDACLRDLEDTP